MKVAAMIVMISLTENFVQAMPGCDHEFAFVTVYVRISFSDVHVQPKLQRAEKIASEILDQAGVQIQWKAGWPKANQGKRPILIEISSDTPEMVCQGALGCAKVYEGVHVRIFWDRIQKTADRELASDLLGHALAHEITHILEGVNQHSPEGVMKAHWTTHDLLKMANGPLALDPLDVKLIHDGVCRALYPEGKGRTKE